MFNIFASAVDSVAALVIGSAIGLLFGVAQNVAYYKNGKRNKQGKFNSGWGAMPGSMSRVAALLVILFVVQVLCPYLFEGEIQWLVSAGILVGYGASFVMKLHRREVGRA